MHLIDDYNDPEVNNALLKCAEALGHGVTHSLMILYEDNDIATTAFPVSESNKNTPNCNLVLTI